MVECLPFCLYLLALLPREVIASIRQMPELAGWKGRPIEDHRLHITILGLGAFDIWPHAVIARVIEALAGCRPIRFRVAFDEWIVTPERALLTHSEPLRGVRLCQRHLDTALGDRGIKPHRPDPHVTIGYESGEDAGGVVPILPLSWQVQELVLVMSLNGRHRHLPLDRWQLAGD